MWRPLNKQMFLLSAETHSFPLALLSSWLSATHAWFGFESQGFQPQIPDVQKGGKRWMGEFENHSMIRIYSEGKGF